jgi:ABC-2 type transport system ATP-binding protein
VSHDELVVRTSRLRKDYGSLVALRALDLELTAGEVFGFLGPNGAGKTTTVKLLLGLVKPTAGTIDLFGMPLPGNERTLLPRVGAIVEAPAFYPYLSARHNLEVLARLGGIDDTRIDEVLELVGLRGAEGHRFAHYSVGMKQRLGLASVLLRNPRLVILDEPTSGLDPQGQRDIDALIRRLADEGRTVFLSSHSLPEVEQICDRVAIMRAGELLFTGNVRDLIRTGGHIAVRVPDADAATRVLATQHWVTDITRDDGYLVIDAPIERAGDVTAALAHAGIFLTELRPRRRTMEALYHEVMDREMAA